MTGSVLALVAVVAVRDAAVAVLVAVLDEDAVCGVVAAAAGVVVAGVAVVVDAVSGR